VRTLAVFMKCFSIWIAILAFGMLTNPSYGAACRTESFPLGQDSVEHSPQRRVVIISDLHLGVGRDTNGQWDKLEDGRWGSEFALF
jgi:hypothetical protein